MADETAPPATEATEAPQQPLLRVITPSATPEEVAALVAVLSGLARARGAPHAPARPRCLAGQRAPPLTGAPPLAS